MGLESAIIGVIISILQLVIVVGAGFLLGKLGPMDRVGELKFALANYYLLLPLFTGIEVARATDLFSIADLGLILANFFISFGVAFFIAFAYCLLSRMDVRVRKTYMMSAALGNTALLPSVIIESLCSGGIFGDSPYCKYGYGYCVFALFMLNVFVWGIGPFVLGSDKSTTMNIRRQMYLIKKLYSSVDEFMSDKDFTILRKQQHEKLGNLIENKEEHIYTEASNHEPIAADHSSSNGNPKGEDVKEIDKGAEIFEPDDYFVLEDHELIIFSLQIKLSPKVHKEFERKYEKLIREVNPDVLARISKDQPKKYQPPKTSAKEILSKVFSPPVVACSVGIVIGLIPPVKAALFSSWGNKIFLKTLLSIGTMAMSIGNMLLGCKFSEGFLISKDMNIRFIDLIMMIAIRLVLLPAIGLGYMALIARIGIPQLDQNKVLDFVLYTYWFVPPSVVFLPLFVMLRHFMREIAILQFWANILLVVSGPVFIVVYFAIFAPT